jgi:hypothetical protein
MPAKRPKPSDGKKPSEADREEKESPSEILGWLRPRKKKAQSPAGDRPQDSDWGYSDLAEEMRKLGLAPAGLGKFITSLHKLAVASKVDPGTLAALIRELNLLTEGANVPIEEIRKRITQLTEDKAELAKNVADLREKKSLIEKDQVSSEKGIAKESESLAQLHQVNVRLNQAGIALDDLSQLAALISSAEELGYNPQEVTGLLASLKTASRQKEAAEIELEKTLEAKRETLQKVINLERELTEKHDLLESAAKLEKLGFSPKDLEDISSAVRMIAKTRNIEESAARGRLLSDLQSYYANDQELRTRLRTLEGLLREKEEKYGMLENELRNERAVLENASKLISSGLDERWLLKLRSIIDAYGPDLDSLARELETQKGLSTSIEQLIRTKKALEEEERLLRQKVVAIEDQRIRTLSLINDLIVHASRPGPIQGESEARPKGTPAQQATEDFLSSAKRAIELIRAKLPGDSAARLVLDHALLALKLEAERGKQGKSNSD